MELNFTKEDALWVATFEAASDFNLHIEGVAVGKVQVYQRGTSSGEYAFVKEATPYPSAGTAYDYDFSALVYPKYMKVACAKKPTMAVVTFAE